MNHLKITLHIEKSTPLDEEIKELEKAAKLAPTTNRFDQSIESCRKAIDAKVEALKKKGKILFVMHGSNHTTVSVPSVRDQRVAILTYDLQRGPGESTVEEE